MTDEIKDIEAQAKKIADSEGGWRRSADKFEERAAAQHTSLIETNDALRREREAAILDHKRAAEQWEVQRAAIAEDSARAARYEAQHAKEWARLDERLELSRREVAALERIAEALTRKP